jgi:hypothetical protein
MDDAFAAAIGQRYWPSISKRHEGAGWRGSGERTLAWGGVAFSEARIGRLPVGLRHTYSITLSFAGEGQPLETFRRYARLPVLPSHGDW